MTWETAEERDLLDENRDRLWNRRTPLYESGDVPTAEGTALSKDHIIDTEKTCNTCCFFTGHWCAKKEEERFSDNIGCGYHLTYAEVK